MENNFTEEKKNNLLLVCKYMEVINVFTMYVYDMDDNNNYEAHGLYIADNEDGDYDYDEIRWVNYDTSLDSFACVIQKVRKRLIALETINVVSVFASNCLNTIDVACLSFEINKIFPEIVKGIQLINDFDDGKYSGE